MKQFILSLNILLASAALFAQSPGSPGKTYAIKVTDFNHLEVDNSIKVDYYANPDSAGLLMFEATPELASRIYVNDNGKGKVDIQCCADCTADMEFPVVRAYSTKLLKVVNSGDSLVTVNNNPPVEKFSITLIGNGAISVRDIQAQRVDARLASGNGQLSVDGACTKAKLTLIGTGAINADRLRAVEVNSSVTGTGTIGCNPAEILSIQGIGKGKVLYRQKPPTIKDRAIGIKHDSI